MARFEITASSMIYGVEHVEDLPFAKDDGVRMYPWEDGYTPVFMDFETADEIVEFAKSHGGKVVVFDGKIEIYNAYRE